MKSRTAGGPVRLVLLAFVVTKLAGAQRSSHVPATAPDSVPAGYYDAINLVQNCARVSTPFYRDMVVLLFSSTATIAQRQAAVDSLGGTVIGGLPLVGVGDGFYLVRLPHDSTNNRPLDAAAKLKGLPGVLAAAPDYSVPNPALSRGPTEGDSGRPLPRPCSAPVGDPQPAA